jgi:hypothetical protein
MIEMLHWSPELKTIICIFSTLKKIQFSRSQKGI